MNRKFSAYLAVRASIQYFTYRSFAYAKQFQGLFTSVPLAAVDERMLIIVGSGRSGNTLLRRLLMEASELYIPPESYVWSAQVFALLTAPGLAWPNRVNLALAILEYSGEFDTFEVGSLREFALLAKEWPPEKQTLGALIFNLYAWLASKQGVDAKWVGDKTPVNTNRLGLVARMFPQAKYIYLERDGVDVCFSYVNAGLYSDLKSSARRWVQSRRAWINFRAKVPEESYAEIKYEDLVRCPEEIICEVVGKFGIPKRKAPLDLSSQLGDVSLRAHHRNVKSEVSLGNIGKGRSQLDGHSRDLLRPLLQRDLVESGYEPI